MDLHDVAGILQSGAANQISDLVHKLSGPMAEEFGLLLGDKVRAYRAQNLNAVLLRTQRILIAAQVQPTAVPARLLVPIMEASSLEDSGVLQELWAGLLATASQETDSLSPRTLKS